MALLHGANLSCDGSQRNSRNASLPRKRKNTKDIRGTVNESTLDFHNLWLQNNLSAYGLLDFLVAAFCSNSFVCAGYFLYAKQRIFILRAQNPVNYSNDFRL